MAHNRAKMRAAPQMYSEHTLRRQLPRSAASTIRYIEVVAINELQDYRTAAVCDGAVYLTNCVYMNEQCTEPLVVWGDVVDVELVPGDVNVFLYEEINACSQHIRITTRSQQPQQQPQQPPSPKGKERKGGKKPPPKPPKPAMLVINFFTFEQASRLFFHIRRAWLRHKATLARGHATLARGGPPRLLVAEKLQALYRELEHEIMGNGPVTVAHYGSGLVPPKAAGAGGQGQGQGGKEDANGGSGGGLVWTIIRGTATSTAAAAKRRPALRGGGGGGGSEDDDDDDDEEEEEEEEEEEGGDEAANAAMRSFFAKGGLRAGTRPAAHTFPSRQSAERWLLQSQLSLPPGSEGYRDASAQLQQLRLRASDCVVVRPLARHD